MKTSTILLLVTASLLVGVPVLHALKLNRMIERKEYILYSEVQREPGQMVSIKPFSHIEFKTANNVNIQIVQGENASLEKDEDFDVQITQRGDTLFIEQKEEAFDFNQHARSIKIQTPSLTKAAVTGVRRSDTSRNGDTQEIRTYNLPFELRISGFDGEDLQLDCSEGGEIQLIANTFKNGVIYVGNGSVLNIAKDNRLDSLSLTTAKGGHINLQGAAIESLTSSIHPESSITLSGMEIK